MAGPPRAWSRARRVGIDATTVEANGASRGIVRRITGESCKSFLRRLGDASGIATSVLVERLRQWRPEAVICDRFRLAELQDAAGGSRRLVPRVTRWSEASEDVRALPRSAADGPLAVEKGARDLIAASLAVALVKTDDQAACGSPSEGRTIRRRTT